MVFMPQMCCRCTLTISHISRMRRNVNRDVNNAGLNVSAITVRIYSARLCIMTLPSADIGLYAREDSEVADILPMSARHRQCRPIMPISADLLPTSARHVVRAGDGVHPLTDVAATETRTVRRNLLCVVSYHGIMLSVLYYFKMFNGITHFRHLPFSDTQ